MCTYDDYYHDNSDADNNCAVRLTNLTPRTPKIETPKIEIPKVAPAKAAPPSRVISRVGVAPETAAATSTRVLQRSLPGLLIKKHSEPNSAYALSNSYQVTPFGRQIETQTVKPAAKAVYQVRVQNNGARSGRFVVKASGASTRNSAKGWTIAYRNGSGAKINAAILSPQGYQTPILAPGAGATITIEMTPGRKVRSGTARNAMLRVFHDDADKEVRDAVQAVAVVKAPQPVSPYDLK